jgi:predicted nucleic acid-binding protein
MTAHWRPRIGRVFVDSSAFYALADRDDNHFSHAQAIQQRLIADRAAWFTSNFIVGEAHALILNRLSIETGLSFLDIIERSGISVIRARAADEARAKEIIRQYRDKDFSYVDALSFAIMERSGISDAFTLIAISHSLDSPSCADS